MPGRPPDLDSYDERVRGGLEILGRAIYEARRVAGVTQRQLGRVAGVHQSTISRLERGRLTGMRLTRLAQVLSALAALTFVALPRGCRPTNIPATSIATSSRDFWRDWSR